MFAWVALEAGGFAARVKGPAGCLLVRRGVGEIFWGAKRLMAVPPVARCWSTSPSVI